MTYARNIDAVLEDRTGGFIHPRNSEEYEDNQAYRGDKVLITHRNTHENSTVHIWIEDIIVHDGGMIEGMPRSFEPSVISEFQGITRSSPVRFSISKVQTVQTPDPQVEISTIPTLRGRTRACDDQVLQDVGEPASVICDGHVNVNLNRHAEPDDTVVVIHRLLRDGNNVEISVGPVRIGQGGEIVGEIQNFSGNHHVYQDLAIGDVLYFSQNRVHSITRG